jgi:hypothetical protein
MSETTIVKGVWWLPDRPEKRLSGEVTYSSTGGAEIDLYDYFFEELSTDPLTVWGVTVDGKMVTLFDGYSRNMTMQSSGAKVSNVASNFSVVGGHFASKYELRFYEVSASLSHLQRWVWSTGIQVTPDHSSGMKWIITQERQPDISLGMVGDFELVIQFEGRLQPRFGACELSESCFLTIKAQEATDYVAFEKVTQQFQHFLALGVSRPVYAFSVKGRPEKWGDDVAVLAKQPVCEVLRKLSMDGNSDKKIFPQEMQFSMADLEDDVAWFIGCYFEKYSQLKPVCNLYFSTLYNPGMYTHQRFLALAHAIEAYHRIFVGGQYQSDDDYHEGLQKILRDAIPEDVDADFRESLKNKFKYLHEYSLRKRLQGICKKYAVILEPHLGTISEFAGTTADVRNHLTHRDPRDKSRSEIPGGIDLWCRCEQLSLLLEVCLLHEIGFSDEKIQELLPRNRRPERIRLNRE